MNSHQDQLDGIQGQHKSALNENEKVRQTGKGGNLEVEEEEEGETRRVV